MILVASERDSPRAGRDIPRPSTKLRMSSMDRPLF